MEASTENMVPSREKGLVIYGKDKVPKPCQKEIGASCLGGTAQKRGERT